ncbi:glycosyl hydrolase family 8 [Sediminicoccus rosea]|jgi:endo-1,4-beta-D-glucanase Y|uniref:Glucanase n=1 Tax=Sediminicoccus rosea TaxID=1225128 RepID=A0ABZ0PPZ6_9PROT|nr:glycosyl hydrolase family 8 [Sediminicoccus rosea]WPB87190.1 glycosyl hydrolase family 8 [Sediminicoccus rosea]
MPLALTHRALILLAAFLLTLAPALAAPPPPPGPNEWQAYVRRYMAPEGRIIDTANRGISHSEGQGYSMLFAVHFDDRARFDLMWNWTRRNLARPSDSLAAWRFDPNSRAGVTDMNNATDGDIFIAWSLLMAAERWNVPAYREAAQRITADILRCCVIEFQGRTLLLPGIHGFQDSQGVIINLSYYAFPALRALSRLVPDARWAALEQDGLRLMDEAAFGRWRLPPDWLLLPAQGGPPVNAGRWPNRFAWDAVRVPLNLAWQGLDVGPLPASREFWDFPNHPRRPPAWVDLGTGEIAPYPGHAGIRAIHALVRSRFGETVGTPLGVADAPDYFGAALVLQTRIAPHMAPQPPALVPPTPATPPSRTERLMGAAQAAWARWRGDEEVAEPPSPAPVQAQWSRNLSAEQSQVRGVPAGLRGLAPPR